MDKFLKVVLDDPKRARFIWKSFLAFITAGVVPFWLFPQPAMLCGNIFDNFSSTPVPYATLEFKELETGTAADSTGYFCLALPSVPSRLQLLVRALGFSDTLITISTDSIPEDLRIGLSPRSYPIEEITVRPAGGAFSAGFYQDRSDTGYGMSQWMQVAVEMKNPSRQRGTVQAVHFYIGDSPGFRAPFRLRLYRVGQAGAPGEDLLAAQVLAYARKRRQWLKIDLSAHQIGFPPEGLFVAMEWINSGPRFFYETKINEQVIRSYGQVLGNTLTAGDESRTWLFLLGGAWRKDDREFVLQGTTYRRNALITCQVQFAE